MEDDAASQRRSLGRRQTLRLLGTALPALSLSGVAQATDAAAETDSGALDQATSTDRCPLESAALAALERDAQEVLGAAPFSPRNIELYVPPVYRDVRDTDGPAPPRTVTDDERRAALETAMRGRYLFHPDREQLVPAAVERFESQALKATIPESPLRAAAVTLTGTVGEPALDALLSDTFRRVEFALMADPDTLARVRGTEGDRVVTVNRKFQYEDFRLLAATVAHEALHRDEQVNEKEEVIVDSIDVLVYAQQLLQTPALALQNTELARRYNTRLLGRLNSRDADGRMTVRGGAGTVFPDSQAFDAVDPTGFGAYRDLVRGDDDDRSDWETQPAMPGNATLERMVSAIVGREVSGLDFDTATVDLLDEQTLLSAVDQLRLFESLSALQCGLATPLPPTTATEPATSDSP